MGTLASEIKAETDGGKSLEDAFEKVTERPFDLYNVTDFVVGALLEMEVRLDAAEDRLGAVEGRLDAIAELIRRMTR